MGRFLIFLMLLGMATAVTTLYWTVVVAVHFIVWFTLRAWSVEPWPIALGIVIVGMALWTEHAYRKAQ